MSHTDGMSDDALVLVLVTTAVYDFTDNGVSGTADRRDVSFCLLHRNHMYECLGFSSYVAEECEQMEVYTMSHHNGTSYNRDLRTGIQASFNVDN